MCTINMVGFAIILFFIPFQWGSLLESILLYNKLPLSLHHADLGYNRVTHAVMFMTRMH